MKMFNQHVENCLKCYSVDVVIDPASGDIICRSCGEVQMGRIIDYSAEWHLYADDDRPNKELEARSSGQVDRIGSTQTNFTGGSESFRDALTRAQTLSTDKCEIKLSHNIGLVGDISARMNLTYRIRVSSHIVFSHTLIYLHYLHVSLSIFVY